MKLPKHLRDVLETIHGHEGEDIRFALGYLHPDTASSYVSKLKRRGLAYTNHHNGTVEVWLHPKGRELLKP